MLRKILIFCSILTLPLLFLGALYLFQDKLPSQREVQRSVKDLKPVKEMEESYRESIELRLDPLDPAKLKGDTPSTQGRPRSGEWRGPASADPSSGWKTSKGSGWRGPGAR